MTNVVVLKNLAIRCIDWSVQVSKSSVVSKEFLYLDHKCRLKFYYSDDDYCLYFKSNSYFQSAVKSTVRGYKESNFLNAHASTITKADEIIWRHSSCYLGNSLLTFEIILHADLPTNACFSLKSISDDFSKLLDEGPHHDVEFTCGDQTIKAHKNILCSRSNVFASMLQTDMVEGKTGRVDIQDMDAAIFKQFLKCLYTGMLPELTVESAVRFYEASDRYGADALRKQCSDFLTGCLTHENACDVLALSDRHSDEDFKKKVIQYVIKEKIPYIGQKWTDFCKENPIPAVEALNLFCQQFRTK